jgi:hypothetical protein
MTTQTEAQTAQDLEWLKRVAGIDDSYINRWSRAEWDQWSRAMHTLRDAECPSVPQWMGMLMPAWWNDFSLPFPCVAQLWPSMHAWFTEAELHSDLTLEVEEPAEGYCPRLEQVRLAWAYTASRGASPSMSLCMVPGEPVGEAVVGRIDAFYASNADEETAAELARILDRAGKEPFGFGPEGALAWEWM